MRGIQKISLLHAKTFEIGMQKGVQSKSDERRVAGVVVLVVVGLKFRTQSRWLGWAWRLENQMVGRGTRLLLELRMNRFNEEVQGFRTSICVWDDSIILLARAMHWHV
jgi:hypothetical protein